MLNGFSDWFTNLFTPPSASTRKRGKPEGKGMLPLPQQNIGAGDRTNTPLLYGNDIDGGRRGRRDRDNAYQVAETDSSLDQVASNLGIPLDQLVSANDGRKTLPPIGSYIDTVPGGAKALRSPVPVESGLEGVNTGAGMGYSPSNPQAAINAQYQNQAVLAREGGNVYPAYAGGVEAAQANARNAAMTSYVQGEKNYASPSSPNSIINSQTMANQARNQYYTTQALNIATQTFQLTGTMPSSSQLPGTVDLATQQSMGFNAEAMMMLGYQFDGNQWVNQGTAAAGGSSKTVNGKQVNWNPATAQTDVYGGQFVQSGATRWVRDNTGKLTREVAAGGKWRKSRGGGGGGRETPVQVIADPNNAGDTAAMGVQLKQGSG